TAPATLRRDEHSMGRIYRILSYVTHRRTSLLPMHRRASKRRCSFAWCLRMPVRSEEHTSELQSLTNIVCRLLLEKKKRTRIYTRKLQMIHSSRPIRVTRQTLLSTSHRP